ncbi:MAG: hypothetical protein SynsKO_02310 [Synoicihabitans sp.]
MWWARLGLAIGTGKITRRFVFIDNANLSTVLSLTKPDVVERKSGAWNFYAYVAREAFMCAVLWLVMGGGMIYPRMAEALGLPH